MQETSSYQSLVQGVKTTAIALIAGGLGTAAYYGMRYTDEQLQINWAAANNFYNEPCGGTLEVTYGGGYSCPNNGRAKPYHPTPNCTNFATEICDSLLLSGTVFIPSVFAIAVGGTGLIYSGYQCVTAGYKHITGNYTSNSNDDTQEQNDLEAGNIQSNAPNENSSLVSKNSYSLCERFAMWYTQKTLPHKKINLPDTSINAEPRPPGL